MKAASTISIPEEEMRRCMLQADISVSKQRMRELLIQADDRLTDLGLDLMDRWERLTGDCIGWDPDAYYTPLEIALHHIAEALGFDYNRDIAAEADRRRRSTE